MRGRDVVDGTSKGILWVYAICTGLVVVAWEAYVLRLIWRWHIAPTCGVRQLTFFHALGVLWMVRLLFSVPESKVGPEKASLSGIAEWAAARVATALTYLLLAYAAWRLGGGNG